MTAIRTVALAASIFALQSLASAQANHLLLSEVGINSPGTENDTVSGEYVEIFNPTASAVNLSNYYIADTLAYYNIVKNPNGYDLGSAADTILRFPANASIPAGGVVVVTQSATQFVADYTSPSLSNFYSKPGSPQLFEVVDSNATVPQMTVLNTNGGGATTFSKTNGGESLVLFTWDGLSDLVKDVDAIAWGSTTTPGTNDMFGNKNNVAVDGPDADTNTSTYLADTGGRRIVVTVGGVSPSVISRISATEQGETTTGGNGITGHDESTEDVSLTWSGSTSTTASNTPGVFNAGNAGVNDWTVY